LRHDRVAHRIDHSIWGEINRNDPNWFATWEDVLGWTLCDGRQVSTTSKYSGLFAVIQFTWGGNNVDMFNLPDLQGYFLRGADVIRRDPPESKVDRDPRFARTDLLHGGKLEQGSRAKRIAGVGSFQPFATALPQGDPRDPAVGGGVASGLKAFTTRTKTEGPDTHKMMGTHVHKVRFELDAGRDVDDQDNTVAFPGGETDAPFMLDDGAHIHDITDGGDHETRPVNASVHWIIRFK
jgi:Phage Tail Collar Domain